jgi:hypothetical protein
MSVSATGNNIQYVGNGLTKIFAFPYLFLARGDVYVTSTTAGVETALTQNVDFTVSGELAPAGGTITFATAPAIGAIITIYRETTRTQQVDYVSQDNFPAETHETALDRLTLIVQDLYARVRRSLRVPLSNGELSELTRSARADRVVGFNGAGNLDLSVGLDAVRTIIIANPIDELTNVTDYGVITSSVTSVADYGTII